MLNKPEFHWPHLRIILNWLKQNCLVTFKPEKLLSFPEIQGSGVVIRPNCTRLPHAYTRLWTLVAAFMISESGNRFFPIAVTDYWRERAGIANQQTTHFSEIFPNLRTFSYLELSTKSDSAIRVSMNSQKLHNMPTIASNRFNIQHSWPLSKTGRRGLRAVTLSYLLASPHLEFTSTDWKERKKNKSREEIFYQMKVVFFC